MSLIQRLESRFGLTRGDVTVALFLVATAGGGAFYTEFVEDEEDFRSRTELARLIVHNDSVVASREHYLAGGFASDSDSVARPWDPLSEEEMIEEGTSGSPEGRSKKLALEDVAPININQASSAVLQLLPGVGEKTAAKIINGRPYQRVEAIMRVKGIGPKKFAKMRSYITVGQIEEHEQTSERARTTEETSPAAAIEEEPEAQTVQEPEEVPKR